MKWISSSVVIYNNTGDVIGAKTGKAYSFPVAIRSAYSEKEVEYCQDHFLQVEQSVNGFYW